MTVLNLSTNANIGDRVGGPELVGCTERDIRNYEQELREAEKGIDAETLIELFASEKEKNPGFFYEYETDSDKRFNRCFWADHVSRRAYSVFGDVVVFDTTYNTNKYGLIFAPFVGVNHHHQTIIFGCGFLSDERADSFVWLLKTFIEAMPNGAPKVIITDQDPAMTKAIAQVFPQTIHRYCLWHILNKFPEKLGALNCRDNYQSIKNAINNSTTPDEFENSWKEVLKVPNLEKNEWLSLMYELRHKHMLAYFRINQVFHLPQKYILKRWTKDAKVGVIFAVGEQNISDDPERNLISRHSQLSYKASVVIDDASLTEEGTNILKEQLEYVHNIIQDLNISKKCNNVSQRKTSTDGTRDIIDPSSVRTKGCGKRLKSSKEKSIPKSRLCHGCGHRGVSHDKRNCPLLQQGYV
ncbi:protein FAR1-RELATED SEQUENCE 3-like [Curcuma longa]|uniref:protein FAR1-RELATED SEQUENCE 3-like n=1 Tax=Curcuma longa TaxID=136217 RepID=UPI003D9EE1EB